MAEQEVIKHTKKVFSIWGNKEHSFWHKFKEFLLEIFIIVFAVSLSIWLHDKSEHSSQQKEVKEFLMGLREDLLSDINEMKGDKEAYMAQGYIFSYIASVKFNGTLSIDTLEKYKDWIYNTTSFQQNNGRFEGFKASGKIGNIEDLSLQNDIMALYQETIPSLLASSSGYVNRKNQFFDYGIKNKKRITDSTNNITTMLLADEVQNICGYLANPQEVLRLYNACIDKMKKIVSAIENKYDIKGH